MFTFITYWPRGMPSASIVSAAIMQTSASAAGIGGAHRIGVELHELAEAARARLLIAEHPALAIAPIGHGERLLVLGDIAGERCGQVIAQ